MNRNILCREKWYKTEAGIFTCPNFRELMSCSKFRAKLNLLNWQYRFHSYELNRILKLQELSELTDCRNSSHRAENYSYLISMLTGYQTTSCSLILIFFLIDQGISYR